MHPLYQALETRKEKYDPNIELNDTGAYGAYKAISKKVTALFEGTLYNTSQTEYVKPFFINTLLDIANIALYVVTIIESRHLNECSTGFVVDIPLPADMDNNR